MNNVEKCVEKITPLSIRERLMIKEVLAEGSGDVFVFNFEKKAILNVRFEKIHVIFRFGF